MLSLYLFEDDAVCLGGTRSNMQHTYLLSEVQGKIWMPLIVNVKLKSADSDQVSRSQSAYSQINLIPMDTVKVVPVLHESHLSLEALNCQSLKSMKLSRTPWFGSTFAQALCTSGRSRGSPSPATSATSGIPLMNRQVYLSKYQFYYLI